MKKHFVSREQAQADPKYIFRSEMQELCSILKKGKRWFWISTASELLSLYDSENESNVQYGFADTKADGIETARKSCGYLPPEQRPVFIIEDVRAGLNENGLYEVLDWQRIRKDYVFGFGPAGYAKQFYKDHLQRKPGPANTKDSQVKEYAYDAYNISNRYLIKKKTAKRVFIFSGIATKDIENGRQYSPGYHHVYAVDREQFEAGKPVWIHAARTSIFNHAAMMEAKTRKETAGASYSFLDIHGTFTASDLKKAYREGCKTHHPDHGGTDAEFISLYREYEHAKRSLSRERM